MKPVWCRWNSWLTVAAPKTYITQKIQNIYIYNIKCFHVWALVDFRDWLLNVFFFCCTHCMLYLSANCINSMAQSSMHKKKFNSSKQYMQHYFYWLSKILVIMIQTSHKRRLLIIKKISPFPPLYLTEQKPLYLFCECKWEKNTQTAIKL